MVLVLRIETKSDEVGNLWVGGWVGDFEDYQCKRRSSALFNSDFRPWGKENLTLLNFFVRKARGR